MRAALLVLALVLAGCARAPAPVTTPDIATTPEWTPPPWVCAQLDLEPDRTEFAPGGTLALVAIFHNCSKGELELGPAWCETRTELAVERDGTQWRIDSFDEARAAEHLPRGCPFDGAEPHLLPAGERYRETFFWNGTFAYDPCAQFHPQTEASCPQLSQAYALEHTFHARLVASGHGFEASARALVLPHDPWPPREQAFCGLSVGVEPDAIAPGEDATIFARYEHCGPHDLTFVDTMICGVSTGVSATVEVSGAPRRLGYAGSVGGGGTADACLAAVPPARIVPPGGYLEQRFGWNGTIHGSGACGADGCATGYESAAPGTYVVTVEARPRDAPVVREIATLEVRASGRGGLASQTFMRLPAQRERDVRHDLDLRLRALPDRPQAPQQGRRAVLIS